MLALASAFTPESFLLRGSMLCCPSSSYGWECLVFYLQRLLSYACWQQRVKQLKWHYSILVFALTPFFFLNKYDPFFEQPSLWTCAGLSISLWKIISLSTRIHFAGLCKLQPSPCSGWSRPRGWWSSNFCGASHLIPPWLLINHSNFMFLAEVSDHHVL